MAFYYYLPEKIVEDAEGPLSFPDFPAAPGGWLGWKASDLKPGEPGWVAATRNDMGLPIVRSGFGRYDEFGSAFKRACNLLGQRPDTVRSWVV